MKLLEELLWLDEFEEVYVNESGDVVHVGPLTEAAVRAFKRTQGKIKRMFRCTVGKKKGKIVSSPVICFKRKDPKKVRVGKKVARQKKNTRIRKAKLTNRTAKSKMVKRLNKARKRS